MGILITGTTRHSTLPASASITCVDSGISRPVFVGGVNVNIAEATVVLAPEWCKGNVRVELLGYRDGDNVGLGTVYALSPVSYYKRTFLGQMPFALHSFLVLAGCLVAGTFLAQRRGAPMLGVPIGLILLGFASLCAFLISHALGALGAWISLLVTCAGIATAVARVDRSDRQQAISAAAPHLLLWAGFSLLWLGVLLLLDDGTAHWRPNNRFWPASWSSDNELPWLYAEALLRSLPLDTVLGGAWSVSDRPPLMAGSYLLLSPVLDLLQLGNDGTHLRGLAYASAAIPINATWILVSSWLVRDILGIRALRDWGAVMVCLCTVPFLVFNTVYAWPKALSAAFCLASLGMALLRLRDRESRGHIAGALTLGLLGYMSHGSAAFFLLPIGPLLLIHNGWRQVREWLPALALAGVVLVGWSAYRTNVVAGSDAVTRYALTGEFGFGSAPGTVFKSARERYGTMTFDTWMEAKLAAAAQPLVLMPGPFSAVPLNSDAGAAWHDRLRALDFLNFSRGNVFALSAGLLGMALLLHRRLSRNGPRNPEVGQILFVVLGTYLLVVAIFLAPTILHHWPLAAIIALAAFGFVSCLARSKALLYALLSLQLAYVGTIWIASPLIDARHIDWSAASGVVAGLMLTIWTLYRGDAVLRRKDVPDPVAAITPRTPSAG